MIPPITPPVIVPATEIDSVSGVTGRFVVRSTVGVVLDMSPGYAHESMFSSGTYYRVGKDYWFPD